MARNVLFKASSFWSLITKAIDSGFDSTTLPDSFVLSESIEARIAGAASLALFVLTALLKSSGRRRACFTSAVYRPPSLAVK